ncbi:MAG: hypothetical protein JNM17_24970 [Archangium sp.]|nr:hypothetical protein [Archangium sp.]
MNNTLLGLMLAVVTVGAQVANAQDWNDPYNHGAVPVQQQGQAPCGPRPTYAPQGQTFNTGRYELQNVQRWVPGQQVQVWVPGQCTNNGGRWGRGNRGRWNNSRCTQGYYTTQWTPGRYETRQEWVWVSVGNPPRPYYGGDGIKVQNGAGTFSMSVY